MDKEFLSFIHYVSTDSIFGSTDLLYAIVRGALMGYPATSYRFIFFCVLKQAEVG